MKHLDKFGILRHMRIDRQIQARFASCVGERPHTHENRVDAADSLRGLDQFFRASGIPYYLVFGTLLSCIREQGLFSYDHDIDIAIHAQDLDRFRAALPQCRAQGFYVNELGYSVIKLRSLPADSHIDIWIIEPAAWYWNATWRLDHALFKPNYFSGHQTRPCYDFHPQVPDQPERLLQAWYGPQWGVKQTDAFALYRPVLSRIFAYPFMTAIVPFRFSHDPRSCRWRPWVQRLNGGRVRVASDSE